MKLELKHLAPYLPYGLKAQAPKNGKIILLKGMYGNTLDFLDEEDGHYTYSLDYAKIILRPLSDLTKEIEHNGEKFVPVESIDYGPCVVLGRFELETEGGTINLFDDDGKQIAQLGKDFIPFNDYNIITHLLEWHFDVFGLIEAGLAIDINTLKEIV